MAGAGATQEKPKKSFEFRMSKKVAELTQVVHMLFTRNHEKEVEIDALKKAYEREIELAIEDARGRISKLEKTVEEQTNLTNRVRNQEIKNKEDEILSRENEWQKKLSESERLLQEERSENQNLRDLLINAQGDIEQLRQGVTDELASKSGEIRKRDKELERRGRELAEAGTELMRSRSDAQAVISELQKTNEKLLNDMNQLHETIDNSNKTRDHLINKNKQLEENMRNIKREYNKKAAELSNNPMKNVGGKSSMDTTLEVERLRREVQRYRLELSNRDNNFNRMFTEKQPVLTTNQRNGQNSKHSSIHISNSNSNNNATFNTSLRHGSSVSLSQTQHGGHGISLGSTARKTLTGTERQATSDSLKYADTIPTGHPLLQNGSFEDDDDHQLIITPPELRLNHKQHSSFFVNEEPNQTSSQGLNRLLDIDSFRRDDQRPRDLNSRIILPINTRGGALNSKQTTIYTTSVGNNHSTAHTHQGGHGISLGSMARNTFVNADKQYNPDRLNRFVERHSNGEHVFQFQDGFLEDDPRPHTQSGATFMHERVVLGGDSGKDKTSLKHLNHQSLFSGEEPHQILPQRPSTNYQDRPPSSSLPSICSTPDRRKTLMKPKPLPRELLHGK